MMYMQLCIYIYIYVHINTYVCNYVWYICIYVCVYICIRDSVCTKSCKDKYHKFIAGNVWPKTNESIFAPAVVVNGPVAGCRRTRAQQQITSTTLAGSQQWKVEPRLRNIRSGLAKWFLLAKLPCYPLVNIQKNMENHQFSWVNQL